MRILPSQFSDNLNDFPYILYLLHYEHSANDRSHYVGSTFRHRFGTRMIEHARSRGSAFTANMARINDRLYVAQYWLIDTRAEEAAFKKSGHYSRHCPICKGHVQASAAMSMPIVHNPVLREDLQELIRKYSF